ncbi:N-terminal Xaa-Pro-Lys N-methyltransferase 1-B [Halyomorpha halys]|uniref:N-terminal Xaa-Pro-Lys N-methyltransferase 1-B n=1 Tax=Halyomorpha halys TaxID=286706 RepID=UPI0006D51C0E|nr:N-terminal Xaa-Pro-Lys N-methyltransferase 1-B [Halyomorpha halys]
MECEEGEFNNQEEPVFYSKAKSYWSNVSPTINGVLGGYGFISSCDIQGSEEFLSKLFQFENHPDRTRALDCGAGIGRITKHLLLKHFDTVDLIDQNQDFIETAKVYVNSPQLGKLYCSGLQNFQPEEKYDLIWCQWVLGHLTDEDLKKFMRNCKNALRENGIIVVKENVTSSGEIEKDDVDSSITRPLEILSDLLNQSGLECILMNAQTRFPKGLYPVKMFALR